MVAQISREDQIFGKDCLAKKKSIEELVHVSFLRRIISQFSPNKRVPVTRKLIEQVTVTAVP